MAEYALGILQQGNKLGIAIVQRSYRQKILKSARTITLQSDPADSGAVRIEIETLLQNLIVQEKLKKARVSVGVETSEMMWNTIEMPPVSREDLRQILQFELESHIPIDPESSVFDIQIQETVEGLNNKVTLFALPKNRVEQIQETASNASLFLDSIAPVDTALSHLCGSQTQTGQNDAVQVILCVKDAGTDIVLSRNGRFVAHRTVSQDNPWNGAIRQTEMESPPTHGDNAVSLIEQTIQIALLMCNETSEKVSEILCVGDMAETDLMTLSEAMPEIQVRRLWIENLIVPGTHYCQVAATALAYELFDDARAVNLLPEAMRPVRRDMGRVLIGVAAGFLLASMVIAGANNYWATDLKLLETEARIASMEHQVNLITDINRKLAKAHDSRNFFTNRNLNYPTHLEVLLETTRLLPDQDTDMFKKVWLEQLDIENLEITLRGDSDSPEGVITILDDSSHFERVRFDGTVTGTRFTIKANISKTTQGFDEFDETYMTTENGEFSGDYSAPEPASTALPASDSSPPSQTEQSPARQVPAAASRIPGESGEPEMALPRGPAFPRWRDEEFPEEPVEFVEEEAQTPDAEAFQGEDEEQMQMMRDRLLDYIQERRESGEFDQQNGYDFQDAEGEESAAGFIEFLRSMSESGVEGETE